MKVGFVTMWGLRVAVMTPLHLVLPVSQLRTNAGDKKTLSTVIWKPEQGTEKRTIIWIL